MSTGDYKAVLSGPVNAVCYDAGSCQYAALLSRVRMAELARDSETLALSEAKAEANRLRHELRQERDEVARLKKRVAFLTDGRE